jgi:hypothetical protein
MRWKIILVNTGIVVVLGLLTYALLATSIGDVVANRAERKEEVARALRAANAQLALDALRTERWLAAKVTELSLGKVYSAGTANARSAQATQEGNRLRDMAVQEPHFAKMAPSLVLMVDEQGVGVGRNGSAAQMRGDKIAEAYPALKAAIASGNTGSDVWLNKQRQEQMLVSYAPVRDEQGAVAGLVIVGTPLNDERLSRTSELSSGQALALASDGGVIAAGGDGANAGMFGTGAASEAAKAALKATGLVHAPNPAQSRLFGASRIQGYGAAPVSLIASVPESLVASVSGLLWPVLGISGLGVLLVLVGGFLLGNYISQPVAELEDGLLAIINGNQDLRFELEHPELGGLVFRINSLLNQLMGVAEDNTDEEGRPSVAPARSNFGEADQG